MVREAIVWLDRTLPLSARFPKGAINREDRLPVPAEALREIIINAVIHRGVSNASSYVAIAVFDDRIEIHSIFIRASRKVLTVVVRAAFALTHDRAG